MGAKDTAPVALICGMAQGFGLSLARALATAGHDILGFSRTPGIAAPAEEAVAPSGRSYRHLTGDLTRDQEVSALLSREASAASVVVYNAHELVISPFLDTEPGAFARTWAVACGGAANVARATLPAMLRRGGGTLIFTGATASTRAGANFSAFASAKFALRGLSQALAREFGPQGVHVAHVILDGLIDEPQTQRRFPARTSKGIDPDAAADAYISLIRQAPSAWTHELDLRPFDERF